MMKTSMLKVAVATMALLAVMVGAAVRNERAVENNTVNSFLGLSDWIELNDVEKMSLHEQNVFGSGLEGMCPIAPVGGHDICGWTTLWQVFRYFDMLSHLVGALALFFLLPYQLFFTDKGSELHKRAGDFTALVLAIQAVTGVASLCMQYIRYYEMKPMMGLPEETGYVLPVPFKFAFLPMFSFGFITPIFNGLGHYYGIPRAFSASLSLIAAAYALLFAWPVIAYRTTLFDPSTYSFQMGFELVMISVVYPLQDVANCVKYYQHFFQGEKLGIEFHSNNVKMLTVIAFTAVFWFAIHLRVVGDNGEQWPIPTLYRLPVVLGPPLIMVATGSMGTYLKYFFGTPLIFPTEPEVAGSKKQA